MPTEALQMLLIPQERLDSSVSVYTLCHITYGKVKCGSHNHRGLQRGLWICWPKSSLDQRGHRGHRKLAQMVPSGGDRVMRSKSTIQVASQPPPHGEVNFSVSIKLQISSQKYFQPLARGLCIVCFDFVCGFLTVEAHWLLRGLAQWPSYFSKPLDLSCS